MELTKDSVYVNANRIAVVDMDKNDKLKIIKLNASPGKSREIKYGCV
jgi:hypothetical protein